MVVQIATTKDTGMYYNILGRHNSFERMIPYKDTNTIFLKSSSKFEIKTIVQTRSFYLVVAHGVVAW